MINSKHILNVTTVGTGVCVKFSGLSKNVALKIRSFVIYPTYTSEKQQQSKLHKSSHLRCTGHWCRRW